MAIATPEYGNDDTSPSNGRQTFVEVRATPASCVAAGYSATSTIEVDTGYQVRGSTVSLANDLVKANEPFFITIIGP